jgi:hypothetical protein
MKLDLTEISQALAAVKKLSSLTYGRYALSGDKDVAGDLATLYRMAVAGIELCESMMVRELEK